MYSIKSIANLLMSQLKGGKKIAYTILLFCSLLPIAKATSTVPPENLPDMTINLYDSLGFDSRYVQDHGRPYKFYANIEWNREAYTLGAGLDIYFGVLSPDQKEVWTFTANGIQEGYVAYETNSFADSFKTIEIPYTFTEEDQKGMYLMFLFSVKTGAEPSNPRNWRSHYVDLFFFE